MRLEVLGAMGTQSKGCHSISLLVGDRVLMDAGTGAFNLNIEQTDHIGDVLITHSHLDHTAMLCFIAESRIDSKEGPGLNVYSQLETVNAIRSGFLNDAIWPNFEKIKIGETSLMSFVDIKPLEPLSINGLNFTPFSVHHPVPTVGFCVHGDHENFVFIADVFDMPDESYAYLNQLENFRRMTIEISFPEGKEELAKISGHMTPLLLEKLLERLPKDLEVFYCHMKPRYKDDIFEQVKKRFGDKLRPLEDGMIFDI
ncbi:MAG: MBL fold metallo-hydrolase [Gammaproteobacteria bacterium WSBS_2016_MAG_OTU1]